MVAGKGRRTLMSGVIVAIAVAACGGGSGSTGTVASHRSAASAHRSAGSPPGGQHAVKGQPASGADGTATVSSGVSQSSLPHDWTACPATATQYAAAVSPATPGCDFARATEVQVQELLHNEGSTVFNTPESIGVSQAGHPQRLLNCVAQHNGPTIVCSDNGSPWVLVFRPSLG